MILVVGATGLLGGLISRTLLNRGSPIRVLARDSAGVAALTAQGADVAIGDLTDPKSLNRACSGVTAVVTTANSMARGGADTVETVDRTGNANLIQAASDQSVDRFVFVSALGADPQHPMPLLRAKGETESLLRSSNLAWTILQPNFFMEVLMMMAVGMPAMAGETVTLIGDGRRKHSLISVVDVAAYVVAALNHPDAAEETLLLGGPQSVSWRDVIAAFEYELGRDVPVNWIPAGGVTNDPIGGLLAALDTYDSPMDMRALSERYDVVPTAMVDYIHEVVQAGLMHPEGVHAPR